MAIPVSPFVAGEFVEAISGETFENRNPATGALLARVANGGAEDIDRAVRSARATFDSGVWSRAGVGFRRERMLAFADLL